MLPGPGRDLAVDGGKALRLAAVIAATVLALATLPDLLKAPEPPPLPADVGFRPAEVAPTATLPVPERIDPRRGPRAASRPRAGSTGNPGRREETGKQEGGAREKKGARSDLQTETPAHTGSGDPVEPPFLPAPVGPPPGPTVPPDGSQEFAPGG